MWLRPGCNLRMTFIRSRTALLSCQLCHPCPLSAGSSSFSSSTTWILAEGIREHYIELYKQYPNAHERDIEALRNFFSTHTKVSANTLDFMVRTFRTLCDLADFEISSSASPITEEIGGIEIGKEMMPTTVSKEKPGYTININIQLALPSDAKKETFDAFFESMKKNLID